MLKPSILLLSILAGSVLAAGCEKTEPPQKAISLASRPSDALPPQARSPRDPSLPDAEKALAAQTEQKKESDLSQNEIRREMPLPGQANDHSTDAVGKKDATPGDKESPSDVAADRPDSVPAATGTSSTTPATDTSSTAPAKESTTPSS